MGYDYWEPSGALTQGILTSFCAHPRALQEQEFFTLDFECKESSTVSFVDPLHEFGDWSGEHKRLGSWVCLLFLRARMLLLSQICPVIF